MSETVEEAKNGAKQPPASGAVSGLVQIRLNAVLGAEQINSDAF